MWPDDITVGTNLIDSKIYNSYGHLALVLWAVMEMKGENCVLNVGTRVVHISISVQYVEYYIVGVKNTFSGVTDFIFGVETNDIKFRR